MHTERFLLDITTKRLKEMLEQKNMAVNLSTTTISAQTHEPTKMPLRDSVELAIRNFLNQVPSEQKLDDLYNLVMNEVEAPFFDVVMQYSRGNQTKAARIMGINRGTLRKKLKQYDLN
jgi:Fis family transcriptional regulator